MLRCKDGNTTEVTFAFILTTAAVSANDDDFEFNDTTIKLNNLPKALVMKC